jgi:hypothetical protein
MSKTQFRWISFSGRALAIVAVMTTGGFLLHAQTAGTSGAGSAQGVSAQEPIFQMLAATNAKDDGSAEAYSSSSSSSGLSDSDGPSTQVAANTEPPFHFFNAQYGGGRQRYGKPKYRGGNTNADG